MSWNPHVTVAAVVEQDGRYLMIEEHTAGRKVLNQPAGHLEPGESLVEAVVRETLEEAGLQFVPDGLLGVYHFRNDRLDRIVIRFCFTGRVEGEPQPPSDPAIIARHWMSAGEILAAGERLRCPEVAMAVRDHQRGQGLPLAALHTSNLSAPQDQQALHAL